VEIARPIPENSNPVSTAFRVVCAICVIACVCLCEQSLRKHALLLAPWDGVAAGSEVCTLHSSKYCNAGEASFTLPAGRQSYTVASVFHGLVPRM
jgi:hypothetical protein